MIDRIRIAPGHEAAARRTRRRDDLGLKDKEQAYARLDELRAKLEKLQQRLYAEARHSVLLVLQGLDASGQGRASSARCSRG